MPEDWLASPIAATVTIFPQKIDFPIAVKVFCCSEEIRLKLSNVVFTSVYAGVRPLCYALVRFI